MAALRLSERRAAIAGGVLGDTNPAWPKGLLAGGTSTERAPGVVNAALASELLYEVGWQTRHCFLDVRSAAAFSEGRARGALNVPYEPKETFVERASASIERLHHPHTPGKHARVIVGCGQPAKPAAKALLHAGYANAVELQEDFAYWQAEGFPCDDVEEAELADSTF